MSKKTCLVAVPIGEAGSTTRQRSDLLLNRVIKPAVEPLGYSAVRLDLSTMPGSLSKQVRQLAVTCDLVIADLTGANPNVLYELGLRHAVHLPFVQLVEQGCHLPFDVADIRTVFLDTSTNEGIERAVFLLAQHALAATETVDAFAAELYLQSDITDSEREALIGHFSEFFVYDSSENISDGVAIMRRRNREKGQAGTIESQSPLHPPRWTKLDFCRDISGVDSAVPQILTHRQRHTRLTGSVKCRSVSSNEVGETRCIANEKTLLSSVAIASDLLNAA